MDCPKCQNDDISESGICRTCGYVISVEEAAAGTETVFEPDPAGGIAADSAPEGEQYEPDAEDAAAGDYDADAASAPPEEEQKPAWRQELSERLKAIKEKRESAGAPGQSKTGAGSIPIPPPRFPSPQPTIVPAGKPADAVPERKPLPRPVPLPKQKKLEPIRPTQPEERPILREVPQRDVRSLIDKAISGRPLEPAAPVVVPLPAVAEAVDDPEDEEGKMILLSRTLSGLVDLIVVIVCSGIFVIAADFFSGIVALDTVSYLIFAGVFLLTYFFYSMFFLTATNQTVGMMITELRVVAADQLRPSVSQLLRRCFGHLASVLGLGFGLIWSLFDSDSQCFHDRISDTRVVRL